MNNIGGLIFGMIAGAIGAAVWAAIAYFGNLEIGWIAWGIGAFVGVAVSYGSREKGMLPAVVAVVITVASLCAGKYAAIEFSFGNLENEIELLETDYLQALAFAIAQEREDAGEIVAWKNGATLNTAESVADMPMELQDEARQTWEEMNADQKNKFREAVKNRSLDWFRAQKNQIAQQRFLSSFSVYDLLFFGLGIFTAGSIAYKDPIESGPAPQNEAENEAE